MNKDDVNTTFNLVNATYRETLEKEFLKVLLEIRDELIAIKNNTVKTI